MLSHPSMTRASKHDSSVVRYRKMNNPPNGLVCQPWPDCRRATRLGRAASSSARVDQPIPEPGLQPFGLYIAGRKRPKATDRELEASQSDELRKELTRRVCS